MRSMSFLTILWIVLYAPAAAASGASCATLMALTDIERTVQRGLDARDPAVRRDALRSLPSLLDAVSAHDFVSAPLRNRRIELTAFVESRGRVALMSSSDAVASFGRSEAFDAKFVPVLDLMRRYACGVDAPTERADAGDGRGQVFAADPHRAKPRVREPFDEVATWTNIVILAFLAFSPFGYCRFREARFRCKRRSQRFDCSVDVAVRRDGREAEARIHDISEAGAKLRADAIPDSGESILVRIGDRWCEARVVWSNDIFFGVEFHSALSEDEICAIVGSKRWKMRMMRIAAPAR